MKKDLFHFVVLRNMFSRINNKFVKTKTIIMPFLQNHTYYQIFFLVKHICDEIAKQRKGKCADFKGRRMPTNILNEYNSDLGKVNS